MDTKAILVDIFGKETLNFQSVINDPSMDPVAKATLMQSHLTRFLEVANQYGATSDISSPGINCTKVPLGDWFNYESTNIMYSAQLQWGKKIDSLIVDSVTNGNKPFRSKWVITIDRTQRNPIIYFMPGPFQPLSGIDFVTISYFFNRYIMKLFDIPPGQIHELLIPKPGNQTIISVTPADVATSSTLEAFKEGIKNYFSI